MRILCLERDNVTNSTSPDENGDHYTASFEFFPFREGHSFSVFKGMYGGSGPKRGEFCVVKTLVDKMGQPEDWEHWMRRSHEAQRLASMFNMWVGRRAIVFERPEMARLNHVSDFNGLFRCCFPHEKRLREKECVAVESFLEGDFQTFNTSTACATMPTERRKKGIFKKRSKCKKEDTAGLVNPNCVPNNIVQAFTHFTWHVTGRLLVCGLQGVCNGPSYNLTTPTIHSFEQSYGGSDGGAQSIAEFFASHRCTNVCCSWPVFNPLTQSTTKKQINFFQNKAILEPTAPMEAKSSVFRAI